MIQDGNGRLLRAALLPRAGLGALLLAGLAGPVWAQHVSQAEGNRVQSACSAELTRYCPGARVTVQPMAICLRQYYLDLSLTCRNALKPQGTAGSGPT